MSAESQAEACTAPHSLKISDPVFRKSGMTHPATAVSKEDNPSCFLRRPLNKSGSYTILH